MTSSAGPRRTDWADPRHHRGVSPNVRTVTTDDGDAFAWSPGSDPAAPSWILLHGSDGRETDLFPLADRLAPTATKVAPRGTVATPHGWAHVIRRDDRTIDEDDTRARVESLAALVRTAQATTHSDVPSVVLGFSNGAITAAALVELHPELVEAAILLRPELPFRTPPAATTQHRATVRAASAGPASPVQVLVVDGRDDARRLPDDGRRVVDRLTSIGAQVTHVVLPVHHGVTRSDERTVAAWLDERAADRPERRADR